MLVDDALWLAVGRVALAEGEAEPVALEGAVALDGVP